MGDRYSINFREDKWFPRPCSFKVIVPFNPHFALLNVGDLIDREVGDWNHAMLDSVFSPMDVEVIKAIALCMFWPRDRLGIILLWDSSQFIQRII